MNTPPIQNGHALSEAPGAKAARVCGILSIVLGVTCVGIPAAIVLGIVALVQQAKAKRMAAEYPTEYRTPTGSGLVTGIIGLVLPILMLPFAGIIAAIAVPAFLSQRERSVSHVMRNNLMSRTGDLVAAYERGIETGQDQPSIQASMEKLLQQATERNPMDKDAPAFRGSITVVDAPSEEDARLLAENEARTPGETVFVISFPSETHAGAYLAGAGRLRHPVEGSTFVSYATALD